MHKFWLSSSSLQSFRPLQSGKSRVLQTFSMQYVCHFKGSHIDFGFGYRDDTGRRRPILRKHSSTLCNPNKMSPKSPENCSKSIFWCWNCTETLTSIQNYVTDFTKRIIHSFCMFLRDTCSSDSFCRVYNILYFVLHLNPI